MSWTRYAALFFAHVIGPALAREQGLVIAFVVAWLAGPHSGK